MFDAPSCRRNLLLVLWFGLLPLSASAQLLAPHLPLRILIVSDEVNPHGLPPAELTQPDDISERCSECPICASMRRMAIRCWRYPPI